jgi:UPF0716 family protein affecting phage T7 exclusion
LKREIHLKKFAIWFFFELALFAYLADQFGFLKMLGLYLFPSFVAMFFAPWLMSAGIVRNVQLGGPMPPIHRPLGFVALLIPSALTRLLAMIILLPGFRHLFFAFVGQKLISFLQSKMQGTGGGFEFRTYQPGQGWRTYRGSPFGREEKDVTPEHQVLPHNAGPESPPRIHIGSDKKDD